MSFSWASQTMELLSYPPLIPPHRYQVSKSCPKCLVKVRGIRRVLISHTRSTSNLDLGGLPV